MLTSLFTIKAKFVNDRYLELASLVEMNLVSMSSMIFFNLAEGSSKMEHWKHSYKIALGPFLGAPSVPLIPSLTATTVSNKQFDTS